MVNYQLGKIYSLKNPLKHGQYIGSTCDKELERRRGSHYRNYRAFQNGSGHYISSFDLLETDDAQIFLLENYPCDTKEELLAREQYWIDKSLNVINKSRACADPEVTKEQSDKAKKKYYETNKASITQIIPCQCGGSYAKCRKARHMKTEKHLSFIKV